MIGGICATYNLAKKLGYKTQAQWGQNISDISYKVFTFRVL